MKSGIYIDEAGRGPFAGPIYFGHVLVLGEFPKDDFKDSKVLSPKQRLQCYNEIKNLEKNGKIIFSSGFADNKGIDDYGLSGAIEIAIIKGLFELFHKLFEKALKQRLEQSNDGYELIDFLRLQNLFNIPKIDFAILKEIYKIINKYHQITGIFVDGKTDFGLNQKLKIKTTPIIDGDAKVPAISMASIIAKVERDELMDKLALEYPKYGFEKHKGYGTKLHRDSIIKHGISKIHRLSFLQNMINSGQLQTKLKLKPKKQTSSVQNKIKKLKIDKPKLLIHACCSPDLTRPLELLQNDFDLQFLWYNPNITNPQEHQKRIEEYYKLLKIHQKDSDIKSDYKPQDFTDFLYSNQKLINYDISEKNKFFDEIGKLEEGGDRCTLCYLHRLEQTAQICAKHKIKFFTTTLSISPHKDLQKIKDLGNQIGKKYGVKFLFFDFKKNDGFKKSIEICKKLGIRRQNYCGCIRSQNN